MREYGSVGTRILAYLRLFTAIYGLFAQYGYFLYSRYKALFYKMKQKLLVDAKDNCIVILTQFDPKRDLHRLGETKVRINFDSFITSFSLCRNF